MAMRAGPISSTMSSAIAALPRDGSTCSRAEAMGGMPCPTSEAGLVSTGLQQRVGGAGEAGFVRRAAWTCSSSSALGPDETDRRIRDG
eukprot:scaffold6854_cov118-Isochrysis_galbana.AAC.2